MPVVATGAITSSSGIKSIQRGTLSLSPSSGVTSITINSVVVEKTELRLLSADFAGVAGGSSTASNYSGNNRIWLTSPTTISAQGGMSYGGNNTGVTISWELTEYY